MKKAKKYFLLINHDFIVLLNENITGNKEHKGKESFNYRSKCFLTSINILTNFYKNKFKNLKNSKFEFDFQKIVLNPKSSFKR